MRSSVLLSLHLLAKVKRKSCSWPRGQDLLMEAPTVFMCEMFSFQSSFPPKLKVRMQEVLQDLLRPCISGSSGSPTP